MDLIQIPDWIFDCKNSEKMLTNERNAEKILKFS